VAAGIGLAHALAPLPLLLGAAIGQQAGPGKAPTGTKTGNSPSSARSIVAFYVGHSLNSDIPDMVASLAKSDLGADGAVAFRFREQFLPGASLRWQWEERDREPGQRSAQEPTYRSLWFEGLSKGGIDALVLVDSVPRGAAMMPETLDFASRFVEAAAKASPAVRAYVLEPWHCLGSGTPAGCDHDEVETSGLPWRERLDRDAPMWDELIASLRERFPAARPTLIPSARALGKLADRAAQGRIPGLASIEAFFDDAIHPNPYGKYFIACLHYAVLTGRSPVGLSSDLRDRWGRSFWNTPNWQGKQWAPPEPAAVRAMQELAWKCAHSAPITAD
jgi:hypothetical protein